MFKFLISSLAVIVFLAGLYLVPDSEKDNMEYTFAYTSTQVIDNVSIRTKVKTCVSFNPDKITFEQVKRDFVEKYSVQDNLDIKGRCDKYRLGATIDPKIIMK